MYKSLTFGKVGSFALSFVILAISLPAKAESYTLPGESSKPSAEEFVGKPGLVGIYYGHLPRDGHPRQKVTLILVADPKSGTPKGYTLEQIGVTKTANARYITKGTLQTCKRSETSRGDHI